MEASPAFEPPLNWAKAARNRRSRSSRSTRVTGPGDLRMEVRGAIGATMVGESPSVVTPPHTGFRPARSPFPGSALPPGSKAGLLTRAGMRESMNIYSDPTFDMACLQFDGVADRLQIPASDRERLKVPKRALVVAVPTRMDDGTTRVFSGIPGPAPPDAGPHQGRHPLPSGRFARRGRSIGDVDELEMRPAGLHSAAPRAESPWIPGSCPPANWSVSPVASPRNWWDSSDLKPTFPHRIWVPTNKPWRG